MSRTHSEKVLQVARRQGVLRPLDLARYRIPRVILRRMEANGQLTRVSRGLYSLPEPDVTEHRSTVEVSKKVPKGVICLLSALRFHGLTTQNPHQIWIAIGEKARRPKLEYPPLRVMRFSEATLGAGVETHVVEGVKIRVFNPAKTVADCFKYRNKIGLDVALEALREAWRERRSTSQELWKYAEICRVANVMRPYLESLT
ncbi:MAG TPA: type IV toxin-antitoxin system AbiEi family antitoxin domain-containing protein [Burkholderiales bacterium]|nr:type IV toxin-antitoxin system AbiEi family antitoxin domain-containing protein [Burkholderiales bacterium]HYS77130.1 type IV toxin-antitoxin system AbiEi family antitoxin domain-containing protein [Burkholderiales bacterium]